MRPASLDPDIGRILALLGRRKGFPYAVFVKRVGILCAAAGFLLSSAPAPAAEYRPGEVLVRFRGDESPQSLRLPPGVPVGEAAASLRRNARVATATANYLARASAPHIPNDPGLTGRRTGWMRLQWNFLAESGVNAPEAWGNAIAAGRPGGIGVRIAVLDTGVAYRTVGRFRRSPDLARRNFIGGYDFVDDDPFPSDENGHGTHVASTIAERIDNGVALTGLAYSARLMPVRVLDSAGTGDAKTVARAIRFAARRGVDIINLSLEFDRDVFARQVPEVFAALRFARSRGALLVSSAGNEGHGAVALPARAPGVIGVGATTEGLCRAEYSNYGRGLDLVGPGGGGADVFGGGPPCEDVERGRSIYQLTFGSSPRRFGYPGTYEGTSMATAHVTGTAALVLGSRVLGARPSQARLELHLERTARDLGPPGWDESFGWGLVNAGAATRPAE